MNNSNNINLDLDNYKEFIKQHASIDPSSLTIPRLNHSNFADNKLSISPIKPNCNFSGKTRTNCKSFYKKEDSPDNTKNQILNTSENYIYFDNHLNNNKSNSTLTKKFTLNYKENKTSIKKYNTVS